MLDQPDLEHARSVGHEARSVQGGLPVSQQQVTVTQVAVHNLARAAAALPGAAQLAPAAGHRIVPVSALL